MRQIPDMIGALPDRPCVHLDRGYDSTGTRDLLDELGYVHEIARKPIPAPIQAGKRWVVERTLECPAFLGQWIQSIHLMRGVSNGSR